jgi:hypothetical protein
LEVALKPYCPGLRIRTCQGVWEGLNSLSANPDGVTEKARLAWLLAFMSPVFAELMSGSSPPLEFFNPLVFVGLLGMYGAGVLLVRETAISWGKGWATVIILGAAYGIIEEGLAVKSFFDPAWMDLGDLGDYGRMFDTNWVWAVWLTIFHSAVSICLPILALGVLAPGYSRQRLLTDEQLRVVLLVFLADIVMFAVLFSVEYAPPLLQYILAAVVVVLLIRFAKKVPADMVSARHALPMWTPRRFMVLGFLFLMGSFLIASGLLTRSVHPIMTIMVIVGISATTLLFLQHRLGRELNRVHKAYFAGGFLLVWVFFGVINEFNGIVGMSVVAVAAVLFVLDMVRWSSGRAGLTFLRRWRPRAT